MRCAREQFPSVPGRSLVESGVRICHAVPYLPSPARRIRYLARRHMILFACRRSPVTAKRFTSPCKWRKVVKSTQHEQQRTHPGANKSVQVCAAKAEDTEVKHNPVLGASYPREVHG